MPGFRNGAHYRTANRLRKALKLVGKRHLSRLSDSFRDATLGADFQAEMARVTGLEPAASGVTGRRSNQLSYTRLSPGTGRAVVYFAMAAEVKLSRLTRFHAKPNRSSRIQCDIMYRCRPRHAGSGAVARLAPRAKDG